MKTRSRKTTKAAPTKKTTPGEDATEAKTLAPAVAKPPHVFILPKGASPEARIITFPDPASSSPNRYFVCPEKGFFEFTKIATPKKACRSWLLAADATVTAKFEGVHEVVAKEQEDTGYVLEKPDMFVATPVDPVFVLLPLLVGGESGSYLTFSDYVYTTEKTDLAQLQQLLRQNTFAGLEKIMERRMEAVCDILDMGDGEDKMYQLSTAKLVGVLTSKASVMAKRGLPASMEERFVRQALETPVLSVNREESSISIAEDATPGAESESTAETSQDSNVSKTTATGNSTPATSVGGTPTVDTPGVSDGITNLLRTRTALDFLTISYTPSSLRATIQDALKAPSSPIDFVPLDKQLQHIAGLKKQAQALRSISDNVSRKRTADDDEDALDKAEAKRKKKEEDEIKKKNTSRGVQQLAKANTTGMKKLSSFFTKAPAKKTA